MTGWIEILTVAFVAQLAVLPGEKGQFIIAALSTRFQPLLVVGAAGTAFAGWTVLEIWFGAAVADVLPGVYLDVLTALLFLVFAGMLMRTAPEDDENWGATTDGGNIESQNLLEQSILGFDLPERFGGFLSIFLLMAAGEFGDKTQLITIGLAAQYGAHPGIWAGEMLAILPVSLLNAYFFHRFSQGINARNVHYAGAILFLFFASDLLLQITVGVSVWETLVEHVARMILGVVASAG